MNRQKPGVCLKQALKVQEESENRQLDSGEHIPLAWYLTPSKDHEIQIQYASRMTMGIMQITLCAYNKQNRQGGTEKGERVKKTQRMGIWGLIYLKVKESDLRLSAKMH